MTGIATDAGRRVSRRLFVLGVLLAIGTSITAPALVLDPEPLPIEPTDLSEMVFVEGGTFFSNGTGRDLEPYWIDRFEVTVGEWARYEDASGHEALYAAPPAVGELDFPQRMVTWREASGFAAWSFKELPSNVQWERASRGPSGSDYPWGSGFSPDASNTADCWSGDALWQGTVTRVGTFESGKSAVGAYDMIGNVWEWTRSDGGELLHTTVGAFDVEGDVLPASVRALQLSAVTGERFIVTRGGSFQTTLIGKASVERLESSRSASFDLGFRCSIPSRQVELQRRLWPLLRDLGYRDPLRILWHTRPAQRQIAAMGRAALPYLTRCAASGSGRLRERAADLIADMEGAP
jgi:hypothetical protein